ncbi:MAG: type II methionyl aminopeptidase [Candidatus Woesearchaeota archaeon]|jgi:methionyl aminopeptidase
MKQFPNIITAEEREHWITAGKITAEVREWSKSLFKPGVKLVDIANAIENKIKEKGAVPAFPVNLSLNEAAAHYTPIKDDLIILKDQIIKVDIGVCYEGAIGDTAYTVDLSGKYSKLVEASEKALENAAKILKIGVTLGEIGKVIEDTILSYGFEPVRNLSGHGMALFTIHTSPSLPNYNTGEKTQLQKGMIIALEPFATTGVGRIKDSGNIVIYEPIEHRPIRSPIAREIAKEIESLPKVPFARRWLDEKFGTNKVSLALQLLKANGNITSHPELVEVEKGMVSQAEHTFLIEEKVICLTQ